MADDVDCVRVALLDIVDHRIKLAAIEVFDDVLGVTGLRRAGWPGEAGELDGRLLQPGAAQPFVDIVLTGAITAEIEDRLAHCRYPPCREDDPNSGAASMTAITRRAGRRCAQSTA